jgi:uncharacterized protein (DUF58 family)
MAIVAGAVAWVELAAQGARIERSAGPPTVVEEEPYPLGVELRSGLLPPPGGELIEPLLGWPVPVAGRWSRRIRINVRFARRGRRKLEPGVLVIRDPLRLRVREVEGGGGEELLVLPRIEPVAAPGGDGGAAGSEGAGGLAAGLAGRRLDAATAELEIDGLRPYREGSPASRIHWPSVARSGEMLERRLVANLDSAPLVVLDASSPASEEALDCAVRAAASLALFLARAGGCSLLLPGDRRPVDLGPDLAGWHPLHVRLAVVEESGAPPPAALAPRAGAVLWVTGADLARAPRSLARLPAAARYVVSEFTVAGCTGVLMQTARGARPRTPRRARAAA